MQNVATLQEHNGKWEWKIRITYGRIQLSHDIHCDQARSQRGARGGGNAPKAKTLLPLNCDDVLVQICIADLIILGDCFAASLTDSPVSATLLLIYLYLWSESIPNAMPPVTFTSCPFRLFSPPVKNPLKCPASLTQSGTGRLNDISALCRLWVMLFGTGLVMSENASNCTQNAAYRDRKLKKILGRGHNPLPIGKGDTLSPNPTPSAPSAPRFSRAPSALDLLPLHFHHLLPPISHFWLRAWLCLEKHATTIIFDTLITQTIYSSVGGCTFPPRPFNATVLSWKTVERWKSWI